MTQDNTDIALVKSVVVIDATTAEGVKPFADMVRRLQERDNVTIAQAEAARLDPYFRSMSDYYARAIEKSGRDAESKGELQKLTSPGGLSKVFNKMAEYRKNTIISEVAILPTNIKNGPARDFFPQQYFDIKYAYQGNNFSFGFVQVNEKNEPSKTKSTTIFGVLLLDSRMTALLSPESARQVYAGVQDVMALANHDMLHHFTLPYINANIARRFDGINYDGTEVNKWVNDMYYNYEDWAQIAHESILLQPSNAPQLESLKGRLDSYFSLLSRLKPRDGGEMGREEAHEAADYFGMVMCHILTRIFPLNHPMIAHAIDGLEKADPLSQNIFEEIKNKHDSNSPTEAKLFALMQFGLSASLQDTAETYRENGIDLLPERADDFSYRKAKMLQLIQISGEDTRAHIPKGGSEKIARIRNNVDEIMLGMIEASATDAGVIPKNKGTVTP